MAFLCCVMRQGDTPKQFEPRYGNPPASMYDMPRYNPQPQVSPSLTSTPLRFPNPSVNCGFTLLMQQVDTPKQFQSMYRNPQAVMYDMPRYNPRPTHPNQSGFLILTAFVVFLFCASQQMDNIQCIGFNHQWCLRYHAIIHDLR